MKRPIRDKGDVSDDLVVVHHLLEALDDVATKSLIDAGLMKYINRDTMRVKTKELVDDDVSAKDATLIGAAAALMRVHWSIHDLMGSDPDVSDIKDAGTRAIAKAHIPHVVESNTVPQEFKDKVNAILKRKK